MVVNVTESSSNSQAAKKIGVMECSVRQLHRPPPSAELQLLLLLCVTEIEWRETGVQAVKVTVRLGGAV